DHLRRAGLHGVGLVVVRPVADVADAGLRQVIERVPGFGEPGPQPADRALAGRPGEALAGGMDRLALLLGRHLVQAQRIGLVVADQLPAVLEHRLDHFGVMVADLAVGRRAGAYAEAL